MEESRITTPHSRIITPQVVQAAREAGSEEHKACVVRRVAVSQEDISDSELGLRFTGEPALVPPRSKRRTLGCELAQFTRRSLRRHCEEHVRAAAHRTLEIC